VGLEELQRAVAALDDVVSCTGTLRIDERLSVMLPDGDVGAVNDPRFVDWLVARGEPAPFGHERETKLDARMRDAIRLRARGAALVRGFDAASLLPQIEAALSPRTQLAAELTDVIVYPVGGHFARHKDTPRSADLLGTLVVGLPIEHEGGAFHIGRDTIDWSGPCDPRELRWVALFSDADHAVMPVTSGARVTLVYALTRTEVARTDPAWRRRMDDVKRALSDLELDEPLLVACAREIIGIDGPQPLPIEALRGIDRDLADVLLEAGFDVTVRACLAARNIEENPQLPERGWDMSAQNLYFARLRRPFTERDAEKLLDAVTFVPASCDGGGYLEDETSDLSDRCDAVPTENWLLRPGSIATFIAERDFSDYGLVGNDAPTSWIYKLAALEVTRRA
jgi:hypothetical protein